MLNQTVFDTTKKVYLDTLYSIFDSTEYIINLPQLKGHMRAGITLFAKNHFGSQTQGDASHLHLGLPCPLEMESDTSRLGYGLYKRNTGRFNDIFSHPKEKSYFLIRRIVGYEFRTECSGQMADGTF